MENKNTDRPARPTKPRREPPRRQAAPPPAPEPPKPPRRSRFQPAAEIKHPKQRAMLIALARLGTVSHAAAAAKVGRTAHYAWLKENPAYAAEVERAGEWHIEALECEADRRAFEGTLEPVVSGGKIVAWKRRHSDLLLIFRLKALAPEKYRERVETKLAGRVEMDQPQAVTLEQRRAFLLGLMRELQGRQSREEQEQESAEHANNGKATEANPSHQNGRAH